MPPGNVIFLNGASSSGKTTLSRTLQNELNEPFLYLSPDTFLFAPGVLPRWREAEAPFSWREVRPRVFSGFFHSLPAYAEAGNNLVVDIVLESTEQWAELQSVLRSLDVFFVGVHCPPEVLEQREALRGDRGKGDAARDFAIVHTFSAYDLEVDSTLDLEENAKTIVTAWENRFAHSQAPVLGSR